MSSPKRLCTRGLSCMPDDVQLSWLRFLDPVSLTAFELTCRAACSLTDHAWHCLCSNYFQATLANPPALDPVWSARDTFRYLMHFESGRRPLWALRMSTVELVHETTALLSNAYLSFWKHWTDDDEYADDICQTLRQIAPISSGGEFPASVDLSFGSYVELFVAHVRELAQRGMVADPWMLRPVCVGDIINHLDISGDVRRDFLACDGDCQRESLAATVGSCSRCTRAMELFPTFGHAIGARLRLLHVKHRKRGTWCF